MVPGRRFLRLWSRRPKDLRDARALAGDPAASVARLTGGEIFFTIFFLARARVRARAARAGKFLYGVPRAGARDVIHIPFVRFVPNVRCVDCALDVRFVVKWARCPIP
jgi:hypothetical protein